jgi:hypothetical protein
LRQFAVFEPLVGTEANGDIHDTCALKLKKRDLMIIGSPWDPAEEQAGNLMDAIPRDDLIADRPENIRFVQANGFFGCNKNRIGATYRGVV